MRWAGPALCILVAGWIFVTLHLGDGPTWVLVGVDRLVGPSPEAQAALSWKVFAVVGLAWSLVLWRGARSGESEPDTIGDE